MNKNKKSTSKGKTKEQNISTIKQEREKYPLKVELCKACDERLRTKDVLVNVNENYENIKYKDLFGESTIFVGPAHVGKSSCLYKLLPDSVSVININCKIYRSQNQFIQRFIELLKDIVDLTDVRIDKKLVANEQLNLNPLNDILNEVKKQIIVIIQYAQTLTGYKKQDLLYNFIDWVKNQTVKNYVGVVYVTRCVQFIEKFEKRVKSRHNSKIYYHPYPSQKQVINMIVGRIRYADCQTTTKKKLEEAVKQNNLLKNNIKGLIQKTYPKKLTFYLSAFQIIFSSLNEDLLEQGSKKQLCQHINYLFTQAIKYLPGQNLTPRQLLLANCDYPDYMIFASIHYLTSNDNYPITFNTIFKNITDFSNRHRSTSTTVGHSMNFQPKIYQRAIKKLASIKLISLPQIHQSFVNKQITSFLNVEEIEDALLSVPNLHPIVKTILKG